MNILFVDAKSWTPYDNESVRHEAVGGTEATLVTVAQGLSQKHIVVVEQYGRTREFVPHAALRYVGPQSVSLLGGADPDVVVILRRIRMAAVYRKRFPKARLYVWIHNWQRPEVVLKRAVLARSRCSVIAVSDALASASDRLINGFLARALSAVVGAGGRVPVLRIYNPVEDSLLVEPVTVDRNRMIFFSTPNKGARQVVAAFRAVHKALPSMQLDIAGSTEAVLEQYLAGVTKMGGIRVLGRLPRDEVLAYVRTSLCVFYPQCEHPETFGLVFAEANAVGTPVMAHDFGAAREVLGDPEQLVDARDHEAVVARVARWREGGRPRVHGRDAFRASTVIGEWRHLLESPV